MMIFSLCEVLLQRYYPRLVISFRKIYKSRRDTHTHTHTVFLSFSCGIPEHVFPSGNACQYKFYSNLVAIRRDSCNTRCLRNSWDVINKRLSTRVLRRRAASSRCERGQWRLDFDSSKRWPTADFFCKRRSEEQNEKHPCGVAFAPVIGITVPITSTIQFNIFFW